MISVVMGVSRFDSYVPKAIDSIFNQTFTNFEFIIITNGKFCNEIENDILKLYPDEKRLKIIKSQIPQLAHALNIGIDNSSFDYIARMDADDIAWPDRLEKQFFYLQKNDLDLVGCNLRLIDENDKLLGVKKYPCGININKLLRYKNCFAHNTVIFRKEFVIKARGYNSGFNSEDYDLWLRLKRMGVKWDNMNETLLDYRIHSGASQRRLLGYAESAGLAMREFILEKNIQNFLAIIFQVFKSVVRSRAD